MMETMRIAYLVSQYPTIAHTYILRELRGLRRLGWDVQAISIRRPDLPLDKLTDAEREEAQLTWYVLGSSPAEFLKAHVATLLTRPAGYFHGLMEVLRFGRFHPKRTAYSFAYFIEAILAGYRVQRAGITHLHSVYSTTLALIIARVFGIPISMTIHGSGEFEDADAFRLRAKVAAASFVCAISSYGRSQILRWSSTVDWHKVEVTPLGIDPSVYGQAPFRDYPDPFELISVGRFSHVKGYPMLLDSVAILVREGRNIRLRMVGDGSDRPMLEERSRELGIASQVLFDGWKNQDETRALYSNADLCVLSSFAEGIPVVLMEAMAMGLPCVATRITGIPELIRDGIDGLLVTPSDPAEMAVAIARLMDDRALRLSMSVSSRERIRTKYNLQANTEHLSNVFQRRIPHAEAVAPAVALSSRQS